MDFLNKIKIFLRKQWVLFPIIFSIVVNASIWIIIYRVIDFTRQLHVLHYNFYFGIDYLNQAKYILFAPIIGIFLLVINFFFSYFYNIKKNSMTLPYILIISSAFINFLLLIYILNIISVEY